MGHVQKRDWKAMQERRLAHEAGGEGSTSAGARPVEGRSSPPGMPGLIEGEDEDEE